MATTLIAFSDLAALAGVEPTDPLIIAACRRASGAFCGAIGYNPSRNPEYEVFLTARRYDTLMLPVAPLNELLLFGDREGNELEYAYYDKQSASIMRPHGVEWPSRWKAIHVVADVGYDSIPDDIQDAVLERAFTLYQNPDTSVTQLSQGSRSLSFGIRAMTGVTQRWSDAVQRYRREVDD